MKGGEAERSEAYTPPCVQEGNLFPKVFPEICGSNSTLISETDSPDDDVPSDV
jgi:hypothetical protein